MEIEVKDWQKFLTEIDLEKINEERKKAGPFVTLVKDRFEVIADFIEDVIKTAVRGRLSSYELDYPD